MISPTAARRLDDWMRAAGVRRERIRYPRPEAGGEVAALRFVPRSVRGRVVVAHGAGNDLLFPLVGLFKALVRARFEVFSFDLDGHGVESTTTFSDAVIHSALPEAVRVARGGRRGLPLHLLGHSLGGSLVLHALASGSVEGVSSAVVVSSPLRIALDLPTALAELRGFLRVATLAQREHYGLWGLVPAVGPLKRSAYPFRRRETADGAFGYVATVQKLLDRMELERAVERIDVPTLLVYGRGDRLVPLAQGERLARALPGAELATVDATHWSCAFADEAVERGVRWGDAHTPVAAG